ncbi:hypothetical protein HGRIS_008418 [Hohenbuehelia grisea]|uniref:Fungal lipase-type domain-containing protein n=1 Tax=Hohenbuehelia grisea TaxID=104357 RepID=A0ABR3J8X7_9AGAR
MLQTGHSLGGALATLDALYLTMHLPKDVHVKAVAYGMPRVGNPAFVKLFDDKVHDFKRINLQDDIIPALPTRHTPFEFLHTKGEIRILEDGSAVGCPGNEFDLDERCHAGSVTDFVSGNFLHHLGPYPGLLRMGRPFCESEEETRSTFARVRDKVIDAGAKVIDVLKTPRKVVASFLTDVLGLP